MAQKKFRPGMSCDKSGKYACYNAKGKMINLDIDVEKGKRFPPSQEEGCYYESK
ncbi:MAG: YjzC family protein [Longicatena sp.]